MTAPMIALKATKGVETASDCPQDILALFYLIVMPSIIHFVIMYPCIYVCGVELYFISVRCIWCVINPVNRASHYQAI